MIIRMTDDLIDVAFIPPQADVVQWTKNVVQ